MVYDIVINKADELIPMLNKMGRHGSLLMVLFAMERQWQLFLQEMNGNAECENLCNSAKECKNILWEHFFALSKHQSSKNRNRYLEQVENLESIEFGDDVYYSRPFIENLMQADFLLSETEGLSDEKNCAYMILSPLQQFHIRVQSDILIKERGENSDGSNENTRNYPCRFTRWNESIRNKQSHADR